jgi:hypothetical protein
MRRVRLLVVLLVVATLVVDLAVVSAVVAMHPIVPALFSHPAVIALFALGMAQVGLIAIWTGFARRSLPWRILVLVLTIGLWTRILAWTIGPLSDIEHAFMVNNLTRLLLGQSLVIVASLCVIRLRGVRLVRADDGYLSEPDAPGGGRLQFSLGYLLSWITVLAVILGLAQYALPFQGIWGLLTPISWDDTVYVVTHAGLVLAALWAVLGTGRPWVRCLVAVLAIAATSVANHLATGLAGTLWFYAVLCILQLIWVMASLSVFRVAGYRMTRMRRAPQVQAEDPAVSPEAG